MSPTDEIEIQNIIKSFLPKTSSGCDGISNKILKNIIPGISYPLTMLINKSLHEGVFPSLLKQAKVVPLFKDKEKDKPNNYRPISLLSSVSKVFEKVIYKRLYTFLEKNETLNPCQFGFRTKHSTIDAVTNLTKDILHGFEKKESTLAVFCDLSKAFDTLDHEILLYKLNKYGIRGPALRLLQSYLCNRSMYVRNGQELSTVHNIPTFGVPQGSILGPLLFNIYVNDLNEALKHSKYLLYADDTTIYITGTDIKSMYSVMNDDLNNLSNWFRANKLALNIRKTKYILFSVKILYNRLTLSINNTCINRVDNLKFLGIHIDSELKWNVHTNYVGKRVAGGLYALNCTKHMLQSTHLRSIYFALVHSHLNYGCLLWGNTSKTFLHKLKVLQRKAIRVICHAQYNAPATPLFTDMKILQFEDLYHVHIGQFMFKLKNETVPLPLINVIKRNHDNHMYNTRQKDDFIIPKCFYDVVHKSFLSSGPLLWSSIPHDLKSSCVQYKTFSKKLKEHFIQTHA